MLPAKRDGTPILKCRECGYEKPVVDSKYKVEYRVKHSPREKIVVVEKEDIAEEETTEDEKRERHKAILEFYGEEEGEESE